ncbi:MAG: nucleotide exchange factor GrpE [Verrucomicrobiota bacterium]|jgi:molecular chaperone GrpE
MKDIDVENAKSGPAGPPEGAEPLVPVEAATVTPEQLGALKERAAKADEHWERLLRVSADFENYKKRAAREKHEAARHANEALFQKLIPVLDSLDMALASAQGAPDQAAQSLQTGIDMIHQQLRNALKESGLEEVNALGQAFDPNLHEAVSQQETEDAPEGQVVQQLRKGYRLRERLLRPATVIVAKQPPA